MDRLWFRMKPYYEDEMTTLYFGDCREILIWKDGDLLLTDPPYGRYFGGRET